MPFPAKGLTSFAENKLRDYKGWVVEVHSDNIAYTLTDFYPFCIQKQLL